MTTQHTMQPSSFLRLGMLAGFMMLASIPAAAQIRQSPADTGRMAWGHKEYTRYTGAHLCDRAVAEVARNMDRTYVFDTSTAPPGEPKPYQFPAAVLANARACADRFTVDGVDPRDLFSMLRIAIVLGDDAKARAAIDRKVKLDTAAEERAGDLTRSIWELLRGTPSPKISLAEEYFKQLQAITPERKVEQFQAYTLFLDYWIEQHNRDSIRAYATRAIELSKRMTQDEQNNVALIKPYTTLMELANESGDLDLQQKLLDQATDDVSAWQGGDGSYWIQNTTTLMESRRTLYGKKTQALPGKYWFNHNGVPRPAPGKASLLVTVSHLCSFNCFDRYQMLRQIHKQYGDQLDITLIVATKGYGLGTGPLTVEEEAKHIADFFLKQQNIPAAVLIDETPTFKIEDGRIDRGQSELTTMFANWHNVNSILVDKEGRIRWFGFFTSRRMFDAALARTLTPLPNP